MYVIALGNMHALANPLRVKKEEIVSLYAMQIPCNRQTRAMEVKTDFKCFVFGCYTNSNGNILTMSI